MPRGARAQRRGLHRAPGDGRGRVPAGGPDSAGRIAADARGAGDHLRGRRGARAVAAAGRAAGCGELLGSPVERVEHFGAYRCRRLYGRTEGRWSEHATGNAIDIAAFVLADGRRIAVLRDWPGDDPEGRFLRRVRDEACRTFGTVLSPDYNAAHADHLHFDQAARGIGGVCR